MFLAFWRQKLMNLAPCSSSESGNYNRGKKQNAITRFIKPTENQSTKNGVSFKSKVFPITRTEQFNILWHFLSSTLLITTVNMPIRDAEYDYPDAHICPQPGDHEGAENLWDLYIWKDTYK